MCRFFPEYTPRAERNIFRVSAGVFIALPLAVLAWDRALNNDKDTEVLATTLCWFLFSMVNFWLGYKIRDILPQNEASFLPSNRG